MENRLTTYEAAKLMQCSPSQVRYLERTGQLPMAPRVGKYHKRMFERRDVERLALERMKRALDWEPGDVDPADILSTC
jgi:DNA-binding transcriptional MerR regulator